MFPFEQIFLFHTDHTPFLKQITINKTNPLFTRIKLDFILCFIIVVVVVVEIE
jgi:hypothetical protein